MLNLAPQLSSVLLPSHCVAALFLAAFFSFACIQSCSVTSVFWTLCLTFSWDVICSVLCPRQKDNLPVISFSWLAYQQILCYGLSKIFSFLCVFIFNYLFFACLFFSIRKKQNCLFWKSPHGSKNNLVYVSSYSTNSFTEMGIATTAPRQSLPKTTLEGDTGWRQNKLNEPGIIGAPRAPHFAPINCVCQSMKVQGPLSGSKMRGQRGLGRLVL